MEMIFFMGAILNADGRRAIMGMPQLALFADRASDENLLAFAQITIVPVRIDKSLCVTTHETFVLINEMREPSVGREKNIARQSF